MLQICIIWIILILEGLSSNWIWSNWYSAFLGRSSLLYSISEFATEKTRQDAEVFVGQHLIECASLPGWNCFQPNRPEYTSVCFYQVEFAYNINTCTEILLNARLGVGSNPGFLCQNTSNTTGRKTRYLCPNTPDYGSEHAALTKRGFAIIIKDA